MKCEACGGDGLIEYDGYRGGNGTETRTCQLCGGTVTVDAATTDTVDMLTTTSGVASSPSNAIRSPTKSSKKPTSLLRRTQPKPHLYHTWSDVEVTGGSKWDLSSRRVEFSCKCGETLIFNTAGQLTHGSVSEPELAGLSYRARVESLKDKARRRGEEIVGISPPEDTSGEVNGPAHGW